MNDQNRLHFGRVEFVGEKEEKGREEEEKHHGGVVQHAVQEIEVPRLGTVQLEFRRVGERYFRAAAHTEHVVQHDVDGRNGEPVREMVIHGEIDAEDDRDDENGVQERLLKASAIQAVQPHGNERHSDEGPVIDHCRSADEQAEEVVVVAHPDSVGEEDGDHGER